MLTQYNSYEAEGKGNIFDDAQADKKFVVRIGIKRFSFGGTHKNVDISKRVSDFINEKTNNLISCIDLIVLLKK